MKKLLVEDLCLREVDKVTTVLSSQPKCIVCSCNGLCGYRAIERVHAIALCLFPRPLRVYNTARSQGSQHYRGEQCKLLGWFLCELVSCLMS